MIEVKILSIRISLMSPSQVVILKELDGARCLPLFIGRPEGDAITIKLTNDDAPRPLTHDLFATVLGELNAPPAHALISELRGKVYHAQLAFNRPEGGAPFEIDCRPSDALAMAVRAGCPIFVAADVMRAAGVLPPGAAAGDGDLTAFSDFIGSLDLGDLSDASDAGDAGSGTPDDDAPKV